MSTDTPPWGDYRPWFAWRPVQIDPAFDMHHSGWRRWRWMWWVERIYFMDQWVYRPVMGPTVEDDVETILGPRNRVNSGANDGGAAA